MAAASYLSARCSLITSLRSELPRYFSWITERAGMIVVMQVMGSAVDASDIISI